MITEPKVVNSGIPQGAFLKRQMVLKPDGMSPFEPKDFRIGLDIGIYGRAIRITDCDEYTRQFFVVSNRPPPLPAPPLRHTPLWLLCGPSFMRRLQARAVGRWAGWGVI